VSYGSHLSRGEHRPRYVRDHERRAPRLGRTPLRSAQHSSGTDMTTQSRTTLSAGILLLVGAGATIDAQVVRQRDAMGREVERRCQPAEWPKKLPALDAVLDSLALSPAVDGLSESDTSILFSILYRNGGVASVRLLQPDTLPSAVSASLLDAVRRGLRSIPTPGPFAAVRVRLQGGPQGTATLDRSVYCPPEPAPGGPTRARIARIPIGPGDRLPRAGQRMQLDAELSIDETGRVTDVRPVFGSGVRELDEAFIRDQWARLFFPAMIDGLPIPSWVRTAGPRMQL